MAKNKNWVSGLEWEDPLHVNRLSESEERRVKLLITKIAALVNMRRLVLRPYFQDYELVMLLIFSFIYSRYFILNSNTSS